ncbi:MAG: Rieske (2Fe-2S) protein [Chloroflexota bacterium]
MARFLTRLIDAQAFWARPLGDFNRRWLSALFHRMWTMKDLLHGRWLGHPLHAASTDLPIGVLTLVVVFDVLGQPGAADVALIAGIVLMLLSAVSGSADYSDTSGTALMRATVHATLMVVALVVYALSLAMRLGSPEDRALPIILSIVGYLIVTAGAFVGGDVVFVLGNMVNRHAFRAGGTKWVALDLGDVREIPEGVLFRAKAGANNLVMVRTGATILALHEQCAHAGGPLAQGTIVDGQVQCPWHGSRFRLADGHAMRGPTVYDQPRFEVRRAESGGGWEARRTEG